MCARACALARRPEVVDANLILGQYLIHSFIDIAHISDLDAAKMLNDMGAHILVDFNGYLSGTRMVRDLAMLLLQLHRVCRRG